MAFNFFMEKMLLSFLAFFLCLNGEWAYEARGVGMLSEQLLML